MAAVYTEGVLAFFAVYMCKVILSCFYNITKQSLE